MRFELFTENMNIISALAPEPAMTAAELQAKFDEGAVKIKAYLRDVIPMIDEAIPGVSDSLSDDSASNALSARKGKELKELIDDKVDRISGKGLSSNDFTNSLKSKLESINISFGTSEPGGSSGNNGDIYIRYEA